MLAADGWHPGVIGIVAARIAERHHRPTVLIALDGGAEDPAALSTGSGRSIPQFDLLAGLDAASETLVRHGGHRAAAGLTIARADVEAFRAAFVAHAGRVLAPEDLVPSQRIDAVAPGGALGVALAEELQRLAPYGAGNPEPTLLVPAATLEDARPLGEGRHVAFSLAAGGARSRAVRFGAGTRLPDGPVDAAVRLELDSWGGAVSPRLVLRSARPPRPGPIRVVGEPATFAAGVVAELDRPLEPWPPAAVAAPAAAERAAHAPPGGRSATPAGRDRRAPGGPRGLRRGRPRGVCARATSRGGAGRSRRGLRGLLVGGAGGAARPRR